MTQSETLFETYLKAQGYSFEFEKKIAGKAKRPDFLVNHSSVSAFCEVKEFDSEEAPTEEVVSIDLYSRVREKINQATRKFREYKGEVCCLVLYSDSNFHVDIETPMFVLGSMYGDAGVSFPIGSHGKAVGPTQQVFLDNGKMISPKFRKPQNTTVSALITLRYVNVALLRFRSYLKEHPGTRPEDVLKAWEKLGLGHIENGLGVIVWENAFAAKPLPRNIFDGPFDVRWGMDGHDQKMIHCGIKISSPDRSLTHDIF